MLVVNPAMLCCCCALVPAVLCSTQGACKLVSSHKEQHSATPADARNVLVPVLRTMHSDGDVHWHRPEKVHRYACQQQHQACCDLTAVDGATRPVLCKAAIVVCRGTGDQCTRVMFYCCAICAVGDNGPRPAHSARCT
jgi:hypothetical protein